MSAVTQSECTRGPRWAAILQPAYLPWLGYFDQMDRADVFVVLDHVQFTRRDWRTRNRILGPDGPMWLSVPVVNKVNGVSSTQQPICAAQVDYSQNWVDKHVRALAHNYRTAPYFNTYAPGIAAILHSKPTALIELNMRLCAQIAAWLGIRTPVILSSTLGSTRKKADLIVDLCERVGATHYYSGMAARTYLDATPFARMGMELWFQDYDHPIYVQGKGDVFSPYLSVVDLLFNVGPQAMDVIRQGRRSMRAA